MHRGTTTAYQAILAKKPTTFIYLDKHVKELHLLKKNLMKESTIIRNPQNLLTWSEKIFKNKDLKKYKKFKISKNIKKELNLYGNYSSKLLIQKIDNLKCTKDKKIKYSFTEISLGEHIKSNIKNTIKKIFGDFYLKKKKNFNQSKVKKLQSGIRSEDIKKIIIRLNNLLSIDIKSRVQVDQISENVVEIETK